MTTVKFALLSIAIGVWALVGSSFALNGGLARVVGVMMGAVAGGCHP